MQVIHDALKSADLPYGAVATIGNYDGIHLGQRKIIDKVVERARELGVQSVLITFDPHPRAVLRPETPPAILTLEPQRLRVLEELGVDVFLVIKFNRDFAATDPESFVRDVLHGRLALEEIYIGEDFSFGKDRVGNVGMLSRLGAELGFKVFGMEKETYHGEVISSTRIRRAIREGKVDLAMELLGRPYGVSGTVVRGDQMGARLGWPTINLAPDNEHLPCDGVYCGQVFFPGMPAIFDCVSNVGTRPTVYENYQRVVESHILGFSADVYGEKVEVRFFKRLRDEKMFPSVMDLSAQIAKDVDATREYFALRRRLED